MSGPGRGVVVIGGGMAGLAAAHRLAESRLGARGQVLLIEAADRLGGKVMTLELAGVPVEAGPDAFLTRVPAAVDLAGRLGLADQLVAPGPAPAAIWSRGRLHRIPAGLVLGVPAGLGPMLSSGILSRRGLARAALEPLFGRRLPAGDLSVADLVAPRFGRELFDRLVDPLLSGIYAGRADRLSAEAVVPQLVQQARTRRSLLLALRRASPSREAGPAGPAFNTVSTGLQTLVRAIEGRLAGKVEVRTGSPVAAVRPAPGGGYLVEVVASAPVAADAVIVAAPAHAAAAMLAGAQPDLSAELTGIPYASVATVALAYPRSAVVRPLEGSGFLVPRADDRLLVGSTWLSAKWPHLQAADHVLVRCAVGRMGDERWQTLDDEELVAAVHAELAVAAGLRGRPVEARVTRWPAAIPQYEVGHLDRLGRADEALGRLPGVYLAGAAYRGIGIPACVQQGREAAEKAVAFLAEPGRLQAVSSR